jgi:signal transduction histidine kinase
VQQVAAAQEGQRLTLDVSGERYRVHLEPVVVAGETLGVLAAGRSLARRDLEVRLFTTVLVGGGAVWTVLASVAAYLIAGRALRPVREAYARQEEFVAGAAHELRSPIGVIRAASEIGLRNDPPEEMRGLLTEINEVASDASNLVDTLLDLARMQVLATPDGEETDLASAVARELARMDLLLQEHRVHIIDDLGEARVKAPAAAVGRVTRALLENIVQHTPPGTNVIVRTRSTGPFGELSVEDDGPGVPPDQLETIFELFSRGDEARRRVRRHSGLGLAIVQSIAQHHGGSVRARTPVAGRGLLVEVHLPSA